MVARYLIVFMGMLCLYGSAQAQNDERRLLHSLELGGTMQVRMGYTPDHSATSEAFDMDARRLRARARVGAGTRTKLFVQGEGAHYDLRLLDVRATVRLTDAFDVRVGRFVVAQPAAYATTAHYRIDALERPSIASAWARNSFSVDGRDFAVQLGWQAGSSQANLALHRGDGGWATHGEYGPRQASLVIQQTRGATQYGLYTSHSLGSADGMADSERWASAWAAHSYWGAMPGSQTLRVKVDVLGAQADAQQIRGASALVAYQAIRAIELFSRAETLRHWTDDGGAASDVQYMTAGFHLSLSALQGRDFNRERLTFSWTTERQPGTPWSDHQLVIQAQLVW